MEFWSGKGRAHSCLCPSAFLALTSIRLAAKEAKDGFARQGLPGKLPLWCIKFQGVFYSGIAAHLVTGTTFKWLSDL